jgi:UDP-N-acetylmuramate--alanine ligase
MFKLSEHFGIVHFIGLGGIGMSGLAEFMHDNGFSVQGSDLSDRPVLENLRRKGIPVFIGCSEENVKNAQVVVYTSAVRKNNEELVFALKKGLPVFTRGEMLSEIMKRYDCVSVAGTHGKTTTTGMIYSVLQASGADPNLIIGGILNQTGSNMKTGQGKWLVAEADESDGTFLKMPSDNVVITNIDPEHLDYYGDFENLLNAFEKFLKKIPFYGRACLCADHPQVKRLAEKFKGEKFPQITTYGLTTGADLRAVNLRTQDGRQFFDVICYQNDPEKSETIQNVCLQVLGPHNVLNSLAALGMGLYWGIPVEKIKQGLADFAGVQRRFTKVGEKNGVVVYDDYAHHPTEIRSVLNAAKSIATGKIIVVFQPHRYTRVYNLMNEFATCFQQADSVIITDIYSAGEDPIFGVSKETIAENILKTENQKDVVCLSGWDELASEVKKRVKAGDLVVCMGAGSVTVYAHNLADQI